MIATITRLLSGKEPQQRCPNATEHPMLSDERRCVEHFTSASTGVARIISTWRELDLLVRVPTSQDLSRLFPTEEVTIRRNSRASINVIRNGAYFGKTVKTANDNGPFRRRAVPNKEIVPVEVFVKFRISISHKTKS